MLTLEPTLTFILPVAPALTLASVLTLAPALTQTIVPCTHIHNIMHISRYIVQGERYAV